MVALGARDKRESESQSRSGQVCRGASEVLSGGMSLVMRGVRAVQRAGLGSVSVPVDGNSAPEGTWAQDLEGQPMGAFQTGLLLRKDISPALHRVGNAGGGRLVMARVVSLEAGIGSTAEL